MVLLIRGINVLENKSELEKALAKQRLVAEQKQKEAEVIVMMIVEFDHDCDQDDLILSGIGCPFVDDSITDKSR